MKSQRNSKDRSRNIKKNLFPTENQKEKPLLWPVENHCAGNRQDNKNKRFELKPMNPDEAAMQMELLDKDFFSSSQTTTVVILIVIYRRRDGNFGLIEPVKMKKRDSLSLTCFIDN